MADNVVANAGSGGATFATDEIDSVQYPRSKIVIGADGVNDGDVSATNPMPVTGPLTDTELRATAVPVSGPLTDTQLRASAVPVSGPLTDTELRASDVKVTLDGESVAITGALTNTELRSTAVPVDGSGVTQPVSDGGGSITIDGSVSISNFPATQPVSGTVSVDAVPLATGAATSAKQDTGNASVASIDGKITACNTGAIAGTVTANAGTNLNTSSLALESGGNLADAAAKLGTIDADTSTLAGCVNGTEMQVDVVSSALPSGAATETTLAALSAKVTAVNTGAVTISAALPAGDNNIGNVDVATLPATPAGTNLVGKVSAGPDTSNAYDGATALTPKFADIDTATSGDNDIVAAVTGKKIRVLAFNIIAVGTAVNVYFHDDTPTIMFASSSRPIVLDKTGATGPGGFNSGYCPVGWFETAAGKKLQLNLSASQGVVGKVVYVEV